MTRLIWTLVALLVWAGAAQAQPLNGVRSAPTEDGPVIEFSDGDFSLADGLSVPATGWKRAPTPHIYRMQETGWRTGDYHTLVGRFRFQRDALGPGPQALFTVNMRSQFLVLLNGMEVGRNFAEPDDRVVSWYRPYLIPLPEGALRSGVNEIEVRAISEESVGVGRIIIGPNAVVRDHYLSAYFWQITAPTAANVAMLVLGLMTLLLWLGRRQEIELLWLSVSAALWFLRNYAYFAQTTPFDLALFNALAVYATYFATVSTAAFYFSFTKLPRRNLIIAGLFLLGAPLVVAHTVLGASNLVFYVPTITLVMALAVVGLSDTLRHRNLEHGVLGLAMVAMPAASVYDVTLAGGGRGWNGDAFYLSVFSGLVYCVAFLISFGKRALDAFSSLSEAKQTLEQRVVEARAELAASEAARRELVVANAVASERGRLMQEMHDGIGSNLIMALAVARRQDLGPDTIRMLRRALNDLKITVDSLEPVEGDLVALIGNLRHRMASDLQDAGIVCRWEVRECGPLPWLDATNALHVLRIFQEAIGNVLTHSGAAQMRIGCHEDVHEGQVGIVTYVADDGRGFFAGGGDAPGKGLANMRARARALHGLLTCDPGPDGGTVVKLWLPYARPAPSPLEGRANHG
jgi:signal transduction histidine kinase